MPLSSGIRLGRYEIRSEIGEGGMGEVYLAEDEQLRRRVALKILPADLASNQDRMRRFVQEAQAAAAQYFPRQRVLRRHRRRPTLSGQYPGSRVCAGALYGCVELGCRVEEELSY